MLLLGGVLVLAPFTLRYLAHLWALPTPQPYPPSFDHCIGEKDVRRKHGQVHNFITLHRSK